MAEYGDMTKMYRAMTDAELLDALSAQKALKRGMLAGTVEAGTSGVTLAEQLGMSVRAAKAMVAIGAITKELDRRGVAHE